MKWKIGAVLMACVFCLAILPPLISGLRGDGGTVKGFGGSSQELVLQEGNANAMSGVSAFSLGDAVSAAVYRSEQGDLMVPASGLSDALELEKSWDDQSQTLTLASGKTEIAVAAGAGEITGGEQTVSASSPAVNTDGTLFIPAKAVAQAFGWGYTENGAYAAISTKKQIKEKKAEKLFEKAADVLGRPRAELLKASLVFRAGSDYVVQDGKNADLEDEEGTLYVPMLANDKFCLPAKAVAVALGGSAEDAEDGVTLTIGDDTIDLTSDGKAKHNGKKVRDAAESDVLIQDDITYVSSSLLCSMLGYSDAGEGEVCVIGSESFAAADSQLAYMVSLGAALPDQRPAVPKAEHYIALTFDDGPTGGSSGLTARLLNGLKERGAHATFFMCGYRIKDFHTHMDRYLAEGHELGNHTMDHPGVLTKKDYDTIVEQIQTNSDLIKSYCGEGPSVFRPVGGAVNDDVKKAAKACGLPIINWSVDTLDWKYRNAEHIRSVITSEAKDGDIVLMHDLRDCTLEGVLSAIDQLREQGYGFVTVEELARIKGVKLEPGEVYTDLSDETVAKIKDGTYEAKY